MNLFFFSLRSLITEYGLGFLGKVVFAHPLKFGKGLWKYLKTARLLTQNSSEWIGFDTRREKPISLMGLGFCLKPLDPPCISKQPNHNCYFFENSLQKNPEIMPDCCSNCLIRELGLTALATGSSLYIMTSAQDVLLDLFVPALRNNFHTRVLLTLCAYSLRPFRLALDICGIEAAIFSFQKGDCTDYATWRKADKGIKDEQTCFNMDSIMHIKNLMQTSEGKTTHVGTFIKKGNIFYPKNSLHS